MWGGATELPARIYQCLCGLGVAARWLLDLLASGHQRSVDKRGFVAENQRAKC